MIQSNDKRSKTIAALIILINFFKELTLNLEMNHETVQGNLPVSPNANKPPCIHPTLSQGTLAGLCHQVGASILSHAGHQKKEEKKTNVFLMGGVLERWEPQGLHTSRILSALCLMLIGLTDTHALALPHLRLPE